MFARFSLRVRLLLLVSLVSVSAAAQTPAAPTADGHPDRPTVLLVTSDVLPVAPSLPDAPAPLVSTPPDRPAIPVSPTGAAGGPPRNVLTTGAVVSAQLQALGVRVAFARRPVPDAEWSGSLGAEVSALVTDDNDGGVGGTLTVGGTVHGARRLGPSTVYVQPGAYLYVGFEGLYDGGNAALGSRLSLDLIRYPRAGGLVAGVGVYGTGQLGSEVYGSDVGVTVTLGAQF